MTKHPKSCSQIQ